MGFLMLTPTLTPAYPYQKPLGVTKPLHFPSYIQRNGLLVPFNPWGVTSGSSAAFGVVRLFLAAIFGLMSYFEAVKAQSTGHEFCSLFVG